MAALEEEFIAASDLSQVNTYIVWFRRNIKDGQESSFGFKAVRRVLAGLSKEMGWGF